MSLLFLSHFDILCDFLLYRLAAFEIELFHIIKKLKIVNRDVSMTLPSYKLIRKNQSERVRDAAYYTNAIGYHVPVQACIC